MKYAQLPNTDLEVSKICLGTMTWGQQNTEAEAHEQLDFAREKGINFIDTAEMYAVPINPDTQGSTERYIGTWLKHQTRSEIILASKAAGPGPKHIRNGPNFSPEHLEQALNDSLERLQTDYLDLYQLHWPERTTNFFGKLGYKHESKDGVTDFKKVLETLAKFIQQGKIRHIGISNETPWGVMQYLQTAQVFDLPRVVSIQNPYNLVNRTFEIGLSEMSLRENVGLLAYSPLGGGLLSGKYVGGKTPKGARYTEWKNYFARYSHPNTEKAVEAYAELAKKWNLSMSQIALAFVNQQDFVTSNIIGATSISQLEENIDSIQLELNAEQLAAIEEVHLNFPNPAP